MTSSNLDSFSLENERGGGGRSFCMHKLLSPSKDNLRKQDKDLFGMGKVSEKNYALEITDYGEMKFLLFLF